ncbi:23S rRNA pseudouridine(1911/1915/1917) synthase RluD [Ketobacter sp. MCCC 1A13808]|uniref:23S rRNA pseudouridine(1911/1915/1917) synthase RluD n=1 Tax=Ketobacter sp. MCCC 1A13808 TaxID=2602738 RepID=UPI000F2450B2|nr:23S rRNA pseudouridine(1911/1915/1917) synthase RluD [Ketobacter sp. MCCC 1A13808]MVF14766.1 23S rRNA pseudouridine(1911/1915/1917) synthase RluD [Ketobacter sp. MCCC 1A13808]RLP52670.1 MAG: 23S rRNA pseudouridine(1911/1915/1917) synthase RluD [Ketobacter sp.]
MTRQIQLSAQVPDSLGGQRLDQAAAELFPDYSRSRLQSWIKSGDLLVDGENRKPREKIVGGETISIDAELEADQRWEAQPIDLDIVYEDDHLLVINKPTGLVVHPAAGNRDSTLLNALLFHAPDLAGLPRAGIVHRIDKETTGLLVVAKTLKAHHSLVAQLQAKTAFREYEAIVTGVMTGGGKVDEPIGRHPTQRTKQAVTFSGKPAVTHFRLIKRFRAHTHIRLQLETGRTHQIRVHMAYIRYPLLGDPTYGGRLKIPKGAGEELMEALRSFKRQALHAKKLGVEHPETGEYCEWEVPLPEDFRSILAVLENDDD